MFLDMFFWTANAHLRRAPYAGFCVVSPHFILLCPYGGSHIFTTGNFFILQARSYSWFYPHWHFQSDSPHKLFTGYTGFQLSMGRLCNVTSCWGKWECGTDDSIFNEVPFCCGYYLYCWGHSRRISLIRSVCMHVSSRCSLGNNLMVIFVYFAPYFLVCIQAGDTPLDLES